MTKDFFVEETLHSPSAPKRQFDALLGGEETASSLGIDVVRLRLTAFTLCALATATLVALSGVIGFIGLMVPHLARAVVGVRHGNLVIASALADAIMLLAGDLVSRIVLAPQGIARRHRNRRGGGRIRPGDDVETLKPGSVQRISIKYKKPTVGTAGNAP